MIKLGRWQVSIEGLLALGLLVALSLGGIRCSAYRQGGDDAKLAQDYANAHKATLAGLRSRAVADSVTNIVNLVTRRMTNRSTRLTAQGDSLRVTLDRADAVLDTTAGRGENTDLFRQVTAEARRFIDSTTVLQHAIDTLTITQAAALVAWDAERAANDATIAAQRAVIRALERRECRVLGVRCPSRRTVFLGGAAATLLLVSVAR
jgi:hypothetical protein